VQGSDQLHLFAAFATQWLRRSMMMYVSIKYQSSNWLIVVQIFARLQQPVDPKVLEQRERDVTERIHAQYEKAQNRQSELVGRDWYKLGTRTTIDRSLYRSVRTQQSPSLSHPFRSYTRRTHEEASSNASSTLYWPATKMILSLCRKR